MAPTVGTLLGGPAGAAVGALVSTALGTNNDPDSVNAALAADPNLVYKLKELQENNSAELQKLMITAAADQYAAEAADRDSARKLAAAQPNDLIRPIITGVLLVGALAILICIFTGLALPALQNPVAASTVSLLIGLWMSELKQSLGFYFGMTKESQKQAAAITDFAVKDGTVSSK